MIGTSARCLGLALPAILLAACSSPPSMTYAPEDASAEDATTDATQDARGEAAPPGDGGSSDAAKGDGGDGGDAGITDGATDAPADSPPPVYAATRPIGANIP
jgi:hypothetical protein